MEVCGVNLEADRLRPERLVSDEVVILHAFSYPQL